MHLPRLMPLMLVALATASCGDGSSPQPAPLMQTNGCLTMNGKLYCAATPTPSAPPSLAAAVVPTPTPTLTPTTAPIAQVTATPTPAPTATPARNAVEPLSDGLAFTLTQAQLQAQFGAPISDDGAGTLTYGEFSVMFLNGKLAAVHLTGPDVKLACGIGPGASKDQVAYAFGGYDAVDYNQYQLRFSYVLATLTKIDIYPANGTFGPSAPDPSDSYPEINLSKLAGTWQDSPAASGTVQPTASGTATPATADKLVIDASGSYAFTPAGGEPQFAETTVAGKYLIFSGLRQQDSWNDGVAHLNAQGQLAFGNSGPAFTQQASP